MTLNGENKGDGLNMGRSPMARGSDREYTRYSERTTVTNNMRTKIRTVCKACRKSCRLKPMRREWYIPSSSETVHWDAKYNAAPLVCLNYLRVCYKELSFLMFTILGLRPRDKAAILDGNKLQFILAEFADCGDVRYKPSITNCYFFCFTPRFSPELTMCSILHA